ncbi:MAG: aminoglycoside phosphotransferase family protein [Bacteroidetes bacterium]|nr:aminoglycoside phosphotransferase family protein [Bacteroidota bacterium]
MLDAILAAYGFEPNTQAIPHGTGLINRTWKIHAPQKGNFILQRINEAVFRHPEQIAENIDKVSDYLAIHYPDAIFPRPARTLTGQTLLVPTPNQYFRLYPFIEGSTTIDVASNPTQAYEAARTFGAFTRMLAQFPADTLHSTLPGFHNLSRRYKDFKIALEKGNPQRLLHAESLISYLKKQSNIVTQYESILTNPNFHRRVTHHDTKISNILFDAQEKGICVIDLDTMMPGYLISDVGDMLRTYLSPVSEEEKEYRHIDVRDAYFQAILEGYLEETKEQLTREEKEAFVYSGAFMMYMQALRFLTDYLQDDIYYGRQYEEHNFVRASNQSTLLALYQQKMPRYLSMLEALI